MLVTFVPFRIHYSAIWKILIPMACKYKQLQEMLICRNRLSLDLDFLA